MSKRLPQVLVALVALFGVVTIGLGVRSKDSQPSPSPTSTSTNLTPRQEAIRAAKAFLDRYVDGSGKVHHGSGDDVVSEGQAYAMLLSVAVNDLPRFDALWSWTRANLMNSSGSLSWHWLNGVVVDANAATDADLDASRALLAAAEKFSVPAYRADGISLANMLLQHDVVETPRGPLLVAGPWATQAPYKMNPSYQSPRSFDAIASATGDVRWTAMRTLSTALIDDMTTGGSTLPPDWAVVQSDGQASPSLAPNGDRVAYGYDAFRTLLRLAEACDTHSRSLAVSLSKVAQRSVDAPAATSNLDGTVLTTGKNPLLLLAAGAVAKAAGDFDRSAGLFDRAEQISDTSPSYYVTAWVALSRVLIDTDLLGSCSESQDKPTTSAESAQGINHDIMLR